MWQRFTERSRRVVFFAQEEAGKLGEHYVSTEHLLLGLLRDTDNVAVTILEKLGTSPSAIRSEIERQVVRGDGRELKDMQLTPRAKRVIDLAYDEARALDNTWIGTEHILLGLINEGEGFSGQVFAKMGIDLEAARAYVRALHPGHDPIYTEKEASNVGNLGTLQDGERTVVEVSVSVDAYKSLENVMRARDDHGYRELYAKGEFFLVAAKTEAKLLDFAAKAYRVRILSGDQTGEAGWVDSADWKNVGADTRPFPPTVSPEDFPRINME